MTAVCCDWLFSWQSCQQPGRRDAPRYAGISSTWTMSRTHTFTFCLCGQSDVFRSQMAKKDVQTQDGLKYWAHVGWCRSDKGTVLNHSAIYPLRLFWCELQRFGSIGYRDVCLLSSITGCDGTQHVVLKAPKIHLKNSTAMSLSRNHDLVTQDNPQTLLWAVSCRN